MPETHCAFLDSAPSVRQASFSILRCYSHLKVEGRADKTGNLPRGLFARVTINFSLFTSVMISLSTIHYKYGSYYLILTFLCIKYEAITEKFPIVSVVVINRIVILAGFILVSGITIIIALF